MAHEHFPTMHTGIIIFVKLTINIRYVIANLGVGDGWGVVRAGALDPPQKKKSGKYFSDYLTIRAFC